MASDFGDDSGEKMLNDFTRFAERMGEDAMRRRADEFRRACKNAKSAAKGGKPAEAEPSEWAKLDMREFQSIEGYDELKPIIDKKLDENGADHTWFTDPSSGKEYLLFKVRDAHEVWASFDQLEKESTAAEERAAKTAKREIGREAERHPEKGRDERPLKDRAEDAVKASKRMERSDAGVRSRSRMPCARKDRTK